MDQTQDSKRLGSPSTLNQRELFDLVDEIKDLGLDAVVDTPQLVVVGDQSSGKSSVLEAIARIPFPTRDSLCTRFATEVVLRCTSQPERALSASIIPGPGRSQADADRLRSFVTPDVGLNSLGIIVDAAAKVMGVGSAQNFTTDRLCVTISGPKISNLTLVDLPGVFHSRGPNQTEEDVESVKQLVQSYMEKQRTVILAVISAGNDLSAQIITKWVHTIDGAAERTMGIVTKPDILDEHPTRTQEYLATIRNEVVQFRLGWHVLRNRKFSEQGSTPEQRDSLEAAFFTSTIWTGVSAQQKGIRQLMRRLTKILYDHIVQEATPLTKDLTTALDQCQTELDLLSPISVAADSRARLLQIQRPFVHLIGEAVKGDYSDPFFRRSRSSGKGFVELRREIEDVLENFTKDMQQSGHTYELTRANGTDNGLSQSGRSTSQSISHTCFTDLVIQRLIEAGRPLGHFDPGLASDLFYEQSKPWSILSEGLVDNVITAVKTCLVEIIRFVDDDNYQPLWDTVIQPSVTRLKQELRRSITNELIPYTDGRPVIFSKIMMEKIALARQREWQRVLQERVPMLLEPSGVLQHGVVQRSSTARLTQLSQLTEKIVEVLSSDVPIERFASAEIVHGIQLLYDSSLQKLLLRFDITNLDQWILGRLSSMLSDEAIESITAAQLELLAKQDDQSTHERERLLLRQQNLQNILQRLTLLMNGSASTDTTVNGKRSASVSDTTIPKRLRRDEENGIY